MNKFIIILCLLGLGSLANAKNESYSLILTRTNTDLAMENNQLTVKLENNGNVELKFPVTHSYYGSVIKLKNYNKSNHVFQLVENINKNWSENKLKHDLSVIKKESSGDLFYSSDSDIIHLQTLTNGQVNWQFTINNLQELKHFYHSLDQWQPLIDLIENVESLPRSNEVSKLWGNK